MSQKKENSTDGAPIPGAPGSENETPEQMAERVQRELNQGADKTGAQVKEPTPPAKTDKKNPPAPTAPKVQAPVQQAPVQADKFYVSAGKSITTKKGILGPHSEVKPEYIGLKTAAEQVAHLNKLEEKGTLYKGAKARPMQKGDNEVKSAAVVETRTRRTPRSPRSE